MTFLIIYGLFILFGLLMGLSFTGIMILIVGGMLSLIAKFIFHDAVLANVVSYICAGITLYIFFTKETS